jgi:RNA polymerase sigma factor (sigma-70 family)
VVGRIAERPADAGRDVVDPASAYRLHAPAVLGYLRTQRVEDPEDLLGEVFYQVARDAKRFSGTDGELRRWIIAIARNRVIDAARRRKRRPQWGGEPPDLPGPPDPSPLDPTLVAALDELTDDQREVMVLRFVVDLSIDEVAAIVGKPPSAVKALQRRATARLATSLEPEQGTRR